jgi:hypothetical protein
MVTQTNAGDATGPNLWMDAEGIQNSAPTNGQANNFWIAAYTSGLITRYDVNSNTFLSGLSTNYTSGNFTAYHYGELYGIFWGDNPDSSSNKRLKFVYATETQSTPGVSPAPDATQKGFSGKLGYGYGGASPGLRKWNYATDSIASTPNKPITTACAEENFDMGQDHNYMLGMYDGAQNNRAWRWTYATDSGYEGGAGMQPTASGIAGRSSGDCAWL